MKFFYLTLVGSLFLLASCNNAKERMLCKRWQVSDVVFINEKEATVQSDTMQGNLQQRTEIILKDVMMKNIYEFKDDGTYLTGNAAANAEGKWQLVGDNIKFISDKGNEQKEKIVPVEKLQDDTLVLLLKQDQTTIQMKLILTPIKP
ncbi:MAG: lipocalin family protein [Bacteroidota bacterium]